MRPVKGRVLQGHVPSRTGVTNSTTYLMNDADTIATRLAPGVQDGAVRQVPQRLPVEPAGELRAAGLERLQRRRRVELPARRDVAVGLRLPLRRAAGAQHSTEYAAVPLGRPDRAPPAGQPPGPLRQLGGHLPAKSPAFNEADVSDKPANQQFPPLSGSEIAAVDRDRLGIGRCLLGVNDGIGELMNALSASGRLNSAHMFFTSDNGYLLGEHRMVKKGEPYEEPSRIPFMVRWPGVAGRVERNLVSSVDLSATVCAIGGTTPPGSDGRNLTPLITTGAAVRDAAYIEPPGGGGVERAAHDPLQVRRVRQRRARALRPGQRSVGADERLLLARLPEHGGGAQQPPAQLEALTRHHPPAAGGEDDPALRGGRMLSRRELPEAVRHRRGAAALTTMTRGIGSVGAQSAGRFRTIVLIVADDMRFDFRTVVANFGQGWIDCVNCAVETPLCGPGRVGLLRGTYSYRTGVTPTAQRRGWSTRTPSRRASERPGTALSCPGST